MAYINIDQSDYIDEIPTWALIANLKTRAKNGDKDAERIFGKTNKYEELHTFERLFLTCRIGDKDKAFQLAYDLAAEKLGRVN